MKYRLWANYLLAIPVLLPFILRLQPAAGQNVAKSSVFQVAQSDPTFDDLMNRGYKATDKRQYPKALELFKEALEKRSGSVYAQRAIDNVESYMKRGRRATFVFTSTPGRTKPAGTRGNCFPSQKPPIPLLPPGQEAILTTQEYPAFYFYIPQITEEVKEMEFVLRVLRDDEKITPQSVTPQGVFSENISPQSVTPESISPERVSPEKITRENVKPLYRQTFRLDSQDGGNSQDGGILKISIPSDSQGLEFDKQYVWGFSLICKEDKRKRDEDLYAEGKIKRFKKDKDLAALLQQRQGILNRADLYATGGFWEDALSAVADLRSQRPNDPEVNKHWRDLLELLKNLELGRVDVSDAINKPFLDLKPIDSELNIFEPRPSDPAPSDPTNSEPIPPEPTPSEQKTSHQTKHR